MARWDYIVRTISRGSGRCSLGSGVVTHPIGYLSVGAVWVDSISTICLDVIVIIPILEIPNPKKQAKYPEKCMTS